MKQIDLFLGLAVMAAPLTLVGLTQVERKPEAAIAQTSPPTPLYQTKNIPCPVVLLSETEGKTVTCGVLTVPENYEQPNGRQVEISYARFHSTSQSPFTSRFIQQHPKILTLFCFNLLNLLGAER